MVGKSFSTRSPISAGGAKKCRRRNSSTIPSRWADDRVASCSSHPDRTDYNSAMNVQRFDPTKVFSLEEMASLRERSDITGTLCVLHAWVVIGAAMAFYAIWPNPLTFVTAVVVIGSRQLGLAILMHDAAHGVLMKTRWWNEWAGQWLC